ncbi:MAG: hypothetical protein II354_01870 [Firmicutes bacterium]|nr:hypothetical protein [Bacillota bacterium]
MKSGVKDISNSCKFTYTMWKYIIISSVVFLGASFWYFSKNHEGMTLAPGGEIEAIYKRSASLISEKIEAKQKEMAKAYYDLRTGRYEDLVKQAEKDQEAAEHGAAEEKAKGDDLKRENDDLKERTETVERNLKDVVSKTAAVVGLDANSSEASEIIAAAKNLMDENNALRGEIDTEQQTIERLDAESERLNGLIDAARKLAKDRQNRISKPDLNCQVNYVDPNYSFVGLNAGIDNGGVVIGSELAVMRNGKQICVLKVTTAESKTSVAEVKKGTMLKGERIKKGDTVKSIRNDQ